MRTSVLPLFWIFYEESGIPVFMSFLSIWQLSWGLLDFNGQTLASLISFVNFLVLNLNGQALASSTSFFQWHRLFLSCLAIDILLLSCSVMGNNINPALIPDTLRSALWNHTRISLQTINVYYLSPLIPVVILLFRSLRLLSFIETCVHEVSVWLSYTLLTHSSPVSLLDKLGQIVLCRLLVIWTFNF